MLPFGVTIPATVPQGSEIPEGLMNNHVYVVQLNDLYSPNIVGVIKSRRMRCSGHVAHMGERRDIYRVLVGKPEGKRPLGRPRCR